MAAPLSQDEIDALLNSADEISDSEPEESFDDDESAPQKSSGSKHVGLPEIFPYRFKFHYNSPVVKNSNYIFNPENINEDDLDESSVVVRSLFNYSSHRKKSAS